MIRQCNDADFELMYEIINDAAQAYRGIIPADAVWAIRFYEKHGFTKVSKAEKERLLRRYWTIPERQVETSVVLAEKRENR